MIERNETQEILWSVLTQLRGIFDDVGLPFFLIGGTLLGFVREGDILKWDKDLDVGILEEHEMLLNKAIERAVSEGWTIEEQGGILNDGISRMFPLKFGAKGRLIAFYKNEYRRRSAFNHLDVFVFYRYKEFVWHNASSRYIAIFPRVYVENQKTLTVKGVTFKVPNPPEDYLAYQYGSKWKIPIQSSDYFRGNANFPFVKDMSIFSELEKPTPIIREYPKKKNYRVLLGSMFCNESHSIPLYVDCLLKLDYPKELIDLVWIENNSSDNTWELLQKYEGIIRKNHCYHSFKLCRMTGDYGPVSKEIIGEYYAGKIANSSPSFREKVDANMIRIQNYILGQVTKKHDFVLYWFPDALCKPYVLRRYIRDMEKYPDAGWFGGVQYRRFPLHRKCECGNMDSPLDNPQYYGIDSPNLKCYSWDEVPKNTCAWKRHEAKKDEGIYDFHSFGVPYFTRAIEEQELLERQSKGNGIFKDVAVTAHIFLIRSEIITGVKIENGITIQVRWRSHRGECGIAFERDMNALGYEMYCDSYVFLEHISVDGKIYRNRLSPKLTDVEKAMTETELKLIELSVNRFILVPYHYRGYIAKCYELAKDKKHGSPRPSNEKIELKSGSKPAPSIVEQKKEEEKKTRKPKIIGENQHPHP